MNSQQVTSSSKLRTHISFNNTVTFDVSILSIEFWSYPLIVIGEEHLYLHFCRFRAAQMLSAGTYFAGKEIKPSDMLDSFRPNNRLIIVRNPWARIVSAYHDKIKVKHWKLSVS